MKTLDDFKIEDVVHAFLSLAEQNNAEDDVKIIPHIQSVDSVRSLLKHADYADEKSIVAILEEEEYVDGLEFSESTTDSTGDYRPSLQKGDDGWEEFVMSQFREDELFDGSPNVHGLRRVASKVLGDIVFDGPVEVKSEYPSFDFDSVGRATCRYEVRIAWHGLGGWVSEEELANPSVRTFGGWASVTIANADGQYINFPEAWAETRAASRAFKTALGISIHTHEEKSSIDGNKVINEYLAKKELEEPDRDWET